MIVTPRWAWPVEIPPSGILVIKKRLTEAEIVAIRQRWATRYKYHRLDAAVILEEDK